MIAALLLARAVVGPVVDASPRFELVKLGWDVRSKACSAQVHGADVGDPRTEAGRAGLLQALPEFDKPADLLGATDVPFPCLQATIEALQKSGRPYKLGFISEPPHP